MSCPTAPCGAVRDDEVVARRAVLGERLRRSRALTRSTVSGSPSTHEAVAVRRSRGGAGRAPRPSRPRPRAARAGSRPARPRSSRGGGRRRARGRRVSSTPFARSRSASASGNVAGTTALVDAERLAGAARRPRARPRRSGRRLRDQLVVAELLDRHAPRAPGRRDAVDLDRADRRRAAPRPARRRGTGRGSRSAPRAAARASGRCLRRSGRPAWRRMLSASN